MKVVTHGVGIALGLLLAGCGGGGGDNTGSAAVGDPATYLKSSQSSNYPKTYNTTAVYAAGVFANTNLSYRWNLERDGLIPVLYSNRKAEFDAGFDTIEAAIGKQVFDRTSLSGKTVSDIARTQRVLIVGEYTTLVSAPTCGLASPMWIDQTNSLVPVFPVIWNNDRNGNPVNPIIFPINTIYVTVNFNPASGCSNSSDLVVHEVAHALGLNGHFDGFGIGAHNIPLVLNVLKKLYSNQPGTALTAIQ